MELNKGQRQETSRLYAHLRDSGQPISMPEWSAVKLARDYGVPEQDLKFRPVVGRNIRLIDIAVVIVLKGDSRASD